MGKFGVILLVLILLLLGCGRRKTVVEFNLVGTSGNSLELTVSGKEYLVKPDEVGYAKLVFEEGEQGYATLKYKKERVALFVEKGKSLDLYIYGDHASENIRFEGSGAPKNIYLNCQELRNVSFDYELTERQFLDQLTDQMKVKIHYLDSMKFDSTFTKMEHERIKYSTYMALENYPLYHAWSTGNKNYLLDTCYLKSIKSFIKEDESLLVLKEYQEGMASLVSLISTYHMKEFDAYKQVKAQFDYVINHLSNETLIEFLIDRYAYAYLMGAGIDEHIDEIVGVYEAYVKTPALRERFYESYEHCMKIVAGQPAFDFTFTDVAGLAHQLKDFQGKYLLINVWASWGVPCRAENLGWEKLEKQFEGGDITFVAVSCNNDRAVWEKRVRENPKGKIQLYMGRERSFMDFYMIRGIPRFILIDPAGKIVNADMSRPSDPQTVKVLREYLKLK